MYTYFSRFVFTILLILFYLMVYFFKNKGDVMSENNVLLDEFNTKKMIKTLEKKKALCPSCEKRLKLAGALFLYKILILRITFNSILNY